MQFGCCRGRIISRLDKPEGFFKTIGFERNSVKIVSQGQWGDPVLVEVNVLDLGSIKAFYR